MTDWIAEAYARPDTKPFIFKIGQKVRLKKGQSNDGQTPAYWDGAIVTVVSMYSTGLMKYHWYKVRYPDGPTCDFEEDDFDMRYAKRVS
jgi:uncharacterized protein YodC (DUF2158 family)